MRGPRRDGTASDNDRRTWIQVLLTLGKQKNAYVSVNGRSGNNWTRAVMWRVFLCMQLGSSFPQPLLPHWGKLLRSYPRTWQWHYSKTVSGITADMGEDSSWSCVCSIETGEGKGNGSWVFHGRSLFLQDRVPGESLLLSVPATTEQLCPTAVPVQDLQGPRRLVFSPY